MHVATSPPFIAPPQTLLSSAYLWAFGSWGALEAVAAICFRQTFDVLAMIPFGLAFLAVLAAFAFLTWNFTHPAWRVRWVALAGGCYALGLHSSLYVPWIFETPTLKFPVHSLVPSWGGLSYVAVLPALWIATYFLRRWRYIARLRAQPDRCFACRYDLAGIAANASCPECGRDRWVHPHRPRGLVRGPRVARVLVGAGIALVFAACAVSVLRWCFESLPVRRSLTSLGSSEFYDLPVTFSEDDPYNLRGRGVIIRIPDHPDRALLVILPTGTLPGLPAMRLYLTTLDQIPGSSSSPPFPLQLNPMIRNDLDATQAAVVLKRGLPPNLIAALVAAGPGSIGNTWITTLDLQDAQLPPSPTQPPALPIISIDAAPYLADW